jgi:hypothetical protein
MVEFVDFGSDSPKRCQNSFLLISAQGWAEALTSYNPAFLKRKSRGAQSALNG